MPKSSEAKVDLTKRLVAAGVPYREIQEILKKSFGSGMSNTTIRNLTNHVDEMELLKQEIQKLKRELEKTRHDLALYKHLYNDLKDSITLRKVSAN